MQRDIGRRLSFAGLIFSLAIVLTGAPGATLKAQENTAPNKPPQAVAADTAKPDTATPPAKSPDTASPPKPNPAEPDTSAPGISTESAAEMLDIASKPAAVVHAQAKWDDGFASIMKSVAKIKEALDKAGLKQAGHPIAIFTQTDDAGFTFDAMLPLSEEPKTAPQLGDDVKIGSTPSGKAIKFQHRGAYSEIDSTYDLITAYLDEKGLEARNFFIEEYLTELKSADDEDLAVDIYVFTKEPTPQAK
jgi:effector-binding domain-containing protein